MNGLISTLPVSPPPVVGAVAFHNGSAVWPGARCIGSPSALSVIVLSGPVGLTGVPSWLTSWNEPVVAEPVLVVGNSGPVLTTAPTQELAGTPVPVTARPVSSDTIAVSVIMLDAPPPVTVSVRAPGGLPAPPRTMPGTQSAGTLTGVVDVQTGGRSMKALLPGPGYSWSPWWFVPRVEFGPVGS